MDEIKKLVPFEVVRTSVISHRNAIILHGFWSEDTAELSYHMEGEKYIITKCTIYNRGFIYKEIDLNLCLTITEH